MEFRDFINANRQYPFVERLWEKLEAERPSLNLNLEELSWVSLSDKNPQVEDFAYDVETELNVRVAGAFELYDIVFELFYYGYSIEENNKKHSTSLNPRT
ncbi:hypothetical protein J4221_00745 [Candidatus Pacearchaeota archaeon]|nr:hypothetical protein [Candidatus Pacearchaeota archaeon]